MAGTQAFLDDLASGEPVPGGGSVAAFEVAMAAALLAMVANLTLGRKKYAGVQDRAQAVLDQATALRSRAGQLIAEDSVAYGKVAAVMALPRQTDAEKVERGRRMQEALKEAAQPPLETMSIAQEVLALANELVQFGNRSAASDVGSAALAAAAGSGSARLNVEINLAGIHDELWVTAVRARVDGYQASRDTVDGIMARVQSIIDGRGT
jgi:formiminotetrahydrofolate cyclodeaminase